MKRFINIVLLLALIGLCACSKTNKDLVLSIDGQENIITKTDYQKIEEMVNVDGEKDYDLLLEYLFYQYDVKVVEEMDILQGESITTFQWEEIADSTFWRNGNSLEIDGEEYLVDKIIVRTGGDDELASHSITDIAALTTEALGIPFAEKESGFSIPSGSVEHVVWFYLDGFGYEGFQTAEKEELIPYLSNIGEFYPAYTIYPPKTSTVTAALLSGLDSRENGVWATGIRKLAVPSIIDAIVDAGMEISIVEGSSTPFNYPNAEIILSGDRNGDGSTDDNVLGNAQKVIAEGIPDLLMVHFHGIDDAGHTYGPYSQEWKSKVKEVDTMVGQLIEQLPEKTLVILFPDHGMHSIVGDSSLGTHGNLRLDDMGIYIILYQK
ncbi:MAG: alkaline phosphatase family protein [Anaerolineaceae bacterium]